MNMPEKSVLKMHYESSIKSGLLDDIIASTRSLKGSSLLSVEDFQGVDQFHLGGLKATLRLAEMAGVRQGMRVLDVGGGIGGAARTLADRFGSEVIVAELMQHYCDIGVALTAALGFQHLVRFVVADATRLPFADRVFDLIWTQHSSMNIPDRDALYHEFFRTLRPGGRLVMHEVVGSTGGAPYYPVPWSTTGECSYIYDAEYVQQRLAGAGLQQVRWHDETATTLDWISKQNKRTNAEDNATVNLGLLLGRSWPEMVSNLQRNLAENRCAVITMLYEKRDNG